MKAAAEDALLLRWGRWTRKAKLGSWPINDAMAGFDNSIIPWLKKRDIAILGWETPDYAPHPPGDLPPSAVHNFALTIRAFTFSTAPISTSSAKPPLHAIDGNSC